MEPNPTSAPPRRRAWPIVLGALVLVAGAGFFAWRVLEQPRGPQETPVAAPPVDAGVAAAEPVDAGPRVSIDDGDALLRTLASGWSTDPLFARWLDAASLRHLVAAVQSVADGESPRVSLPFVSLGGGFTVREEKAPAPKKKPKHRAPAPEPRLIISTESYARYDLPTQALTSVPADTAGAAYGQLRPFLDAVFSEVGRPGKRFDDVFTAALQRVLSVPLPDGEVEVVPKGLAYAFKDESLERLSPAEKHVLRMGRANASALQQWLKTFGERAGLLRAR